MTLRKTLIMAVCMMALPVDAANAQVVIHTGPPPPVIVERPGPPRHAGWVWIPGYYRWSGRRYVWVNGYWARPPRPHAVWIPGRWLARRGGYVWIAGYWR